MTYLDLEASPVVRRDQYPADVTLPDGQHLTRALVVVTVGAVYVWTAADTEPVYAATITGAVLPSRFAGSFATASAVTTSGETVEWTAGQGCRCGVLARYRPFTSPRRAQ